MRLSGRLFALPPLFGPGLIRAQCGAMVVMVSVRWQSCSGGGCFFN